jgi:hypothetical protein
MMVRIAFIRIIKQAKMQNDDTNNPYSYHEKRKKQNDVTTYGLCVAKIVTFTNRTRL